MANKWYQDDKGNVSSLRIIAVPSAIIGQMVVIAGVVAGLVGLAEGAKAWQKQGEK
jgi:hypothetical protein